MKLMCTWAHDFSYSGARRYTILTVIFVGIALSSSGVYAQNSGEPYVNCSMLGSCGTPPAAPSGGYVDATQFPSNRTGFPNDICAKINYALNFAAGNTIPPVSPATVFTIDARGFTGVQACNSNPFGIPPGRTAGLNLPIRLLLGNVVIVTSAPWFTPAFAHSIQGIVPGFQFTGFEGTVIAACGPGLNGVNGINYNVNTSSPNTCSWAGGSVPQFPQSTAVTLTFTIAHGPFPKSSSLPPGSAPYACVICGGGEGPTGDGSGWSTNGSGEEIRDLRIDIGGNSNIFGYYTQNEMERNVLELMQIGGFGSQSPVSGVTATSSNAADMFYDDTETPASNPASRNVIRDISLLGNYGCGSLCYGIVYEGVVNGSTNLAGGPIVENVNIFNDGSEAVMTDGIWMQGIENPIVGHLHCKGMTGYCEHYAITEPMHAGVFIAHDMLAGGGSLIDLGPNIDNNQTLMTLTSAANSILNDQKNGVTIASGAYPSGIGEYLPGNMLMGSTGGTAPIQGPILYGHLNNATAASANAGTCTFPPTSSLSCTVNFIPPFQVAPACVANDQSSSAIITPTPGTSSVTFSGGAGSNHNDVIAYHCEGNPN